MKNPKDSENASRKAPITGQSAMRRPDASAEFPRILSTSPANNTRSTPSRRLSGNGGNRLRKMHDDLAEPPSRGALSNTSSVASLRHRANRPDRDFSETTAPLLMRDSSPIRRRSVAPPQAGTAPTPRYRPGTTPFQRRSAYSIGRRRIVAERCQSARCVLINRQLYAKYLCPDVRHGDCEISRASHTEIGFSIALLAVSDRHIAKNGSTWPRKIGSLLAGFPTGDRVYFFLLRLGYALPSYPGRPRATASLTVARTASRYRHAPASPRSAGHGCTGPNAA